MGRRVASPTEKLAHDLLGRGETMEPAIPALVAGQLARLDPPHWPPHEGKQSLFLSPLVTSIFEVYYGGAAGGGKTDALLMAAVQFVDVTGYSAVIVRRTFPMLAQPGGLIERSLAWFGNVARWNEGNHRWTFPSGATLVFRHLQNEQALADYQGAEYQFVGVDEVTDLSLREYTFLFSRLRRGRGLDVPLRVRSASNPIGPGRDWVHQRFVLAGPSTGRLFIPARLEDNPALDREEYERVLVELGSIDYRRLRFGDWDVRSEGKTFKRAWFQMIDPGDVPAGVKHVRYWDLAATETPRGQLHRKAGDPDFTAGVLLARSPDGLYFVDHVERFRARSLEVEDRVAATAATDGRDVPIRMEQEPGASGKALIDRYRRTVLDGYDFRGVRSTGSKELRAAPVAARAEAGDVRIVAGSWNAAFLDELADFPDPSVHDDQVDALSGAFAALAGAPAGEPMPGGLKAGSHWRNL